ncbi:hypothetical protein UFOVP148_63 [uncultured Caudovirales phage]|uniref:Uncharacterized protein n=1 Tax=uncultured Caudovirales phage TaxID=2100421 RepID=A0A6J7W9B0_9CAUD|nr:hypothetical protein UFOVP148_63 [uncultured Caudovirales phage]
MTKYYSKSANGFYDSVIHDALPKDAKEITEEKWQNLIQDMANGKILKADKAENPFTEDAPTPELTPADFAFGLKNHLDNFAKSWGYDSILSAASYLGSANEQFKAEAEALVCWRDSCWEKFTATKTFPANVQSFLDSLPATPIK